MEEWLYNKTFSQSIDIDLSFYENMPFVLYRKQKLQNQHWLGFMDK